MSHVVITCPRCGFEFVEDIPEQKGKKRIKCPICGKEMIVEPCTDRNGEVVRKIVFRRERGEE